MVTKAEVKGKIQDWLRDQGWFVVSFAWHRRMPVTLKDYPDITAFRKDRVLLVETKAPGKPLRPGQKTFAETIQQYTGGHLIYCLAYSLDDVKAELWKTQKQEEN